MQILSDVIGVLKKELTDGRDAVIGKYLSNGLADNESRHAAGQGFAYNKLLNMVLELEKQIFGNNNSMAPTNPNVATVSIPVGEDERSGEATPVEGDVV